MDIQTILVYLIFGCCILYVIKAFIKSLHRKKDSGCGCGCSGCSMTQKHKESSDCCSNKKD